MAKYLLCKKMHGGGCDYTIGCGMRFDWIEAESIEAAIEKAVWPDGRDEHCALVGEMALSDLFIIPAEHVKVLPVAEMTFAVEQDLRERARKAKESAERAEFERLQKKFA